MSVKDKQSIEMQKENTGDNTLESIQKAQPENAAKREQWWEAALFPDPSYVSDR